MTQDVVIVGGGLAGLVSALGLSQAGVQVTLVEKKAYPFHKVCGEYVSNEVQPYLQKLGVNLAALKPATISRFMLSSPTGNTLETELDLGGFGISRYSFDHHLYQLACERGVHFILEQQVQDVTFDTDHFDVAVSDGKVLRARIVLGTYGKRTNLDRQLNRPFFRSRSPYIGVKYHLHHNFPKDLIALHNFDNGYAGISAIEDNRYCFCYLTTRENLKKYGSIPAMEQAVLHKNPYLRQIFKEAEFLYDQPEVINEISFATKTCIENHMLMCGDAAGMITPLCGNGMAMAIHSGKIATEHVLAFFNKHENRQELEANYSKAWKEKFANRMTVGRTVQQLFGNTILSEVAISLLKHVPFATRQVMRQTHGEPF